MQKLVFINGGGQTIDLTSGNFGITNWEGLSGVGLNIQTQQVPFQDGGVFLDALMEQREISVTVAIQDNNDLSARYERKRQLISALNPKLGEGVLVYTNDYLSRQIKAVPQLPIFENKNSNDAGTLKANVVFSCPSPYWEDLEETIVNFDSDGKAEIQNAGDIPTGVEIHLITSFVENPTILKSNEDKIKYTGELSNDLNIDTRFGKKTVTKINRKMNISKINVNYIDIVFAVDKGFYIAITSNDILKSYDLQSWETIGNTDIYMNAICYSEEKGTFCIAGSFGILTSTDTINWTKTKNASIYSYNIIYSKFLGLFIASTEGGQLLESSDGITWTEITITDSTDVKGMVSVEDWGKVYIGTSQYIYESTNGTSWTKKHTESGLVYFQSACYSLFLNQVCFSDSKGNVYISNDGTTWNKTTVSNNKYINGIIYSTTFRKYYGIIPRSENYNGYIIESENGTDWTMTEKGGDYFNKITNIEFYGLIITLGTGFISISNNGVVTIPPYEVFDSNFSNIKYIEKYDIFIMLYLTKIYISYDCIKWEQVYEGEVQLFDICFSNYLNKVFVFGSSVTLISENGVNWELNASTITIRKVVYSEKHHKFCGGGASDIYMSNDGIVWEQTAVFSGLNELVYSEVNDIYVASNYNNVYSSTDGTTWTTRITNYNRIVGLCYSEEKNLFIALKDTETYISRNGIDWTIFARQTAISGMIIYSDFNKLFIAYNKTGSDVYLYSSPDGIQWFEYYHTADNMDFITNSNYRKMIIGASENIYYETEGTKENVIQNIDPDSNLGMKLEVGENKFYLYKTNGYFTAQIKYRQKYIGV